MATQVTNYQCPACTGPLQFNAETGKLGCEFCGTAYEVAEIEARPGSKITRGAVKDLNLSRDMTIAGLVRDGVGMLVTGNTHIQAGDHVVIFCLTGALHKVEKLFN